jgi:hypothetical protein
MSFTPNYLSQRDPRWKDEKLGFDDTATIGTDGCALICLTMLVNGYRFNETPDTLNQKLKAMAPGAGSKWLNVREPGGQTGYVAAWYVH